MLVAVLVHALQGGKPCRHYSIAWHRLSHCHPVAGFNAANKMLTMGMLRTFIPTHHTAYTPGEGAYLYVPNETASADPTLNLSAYIHLKLAFESTDLSSFTAIWREEENQEYLLHKLTCEYSDEPRSLNFTYFISQKKKNLNSLKSTKTLPVSQNSCWVDRCYHPLRIIKQLNGDRHEFELRDTGLKPWVENSQYSRHCLAHPEQYLLVDITQPLHPVWKPGALLARTPSLFPLVLQSRETGWKHAEASFFLNAYAK